MVWFIGGFPTAGRGAGADHANRSAAAAYRLCPSRGQTQGLHRRARQEDVARHRSAAKRRSHPNSTALAAGRGWGWLFWFRLREKQAAGPRRICASSYLFHSIRPTSSTLNQRWLGWFQFFFYASAQTKELQVSARTRQRHQVAMQPTSCIFPGLCLETIRAMQSG